MAAIKSAISLGMIYIPITLQKTNRDMNISFNQLSKETKERINYIKTCPHCSKELKNEDIIKGYEFEKGQYVTFDNEELEKIKSKKDRTIQIIHFAKMNEIDQIYYEKDYYTVPTMGSEKAFELLRQAMLSKKVVAIAKTVMGTKEELVVLSPTKEGIIAKILFYREEINLYPSYNKASVDKTELEMAKTLIQSMINEFDISKYKDEYQIKLMEAIKMKIEGQQIVQISDSKQQSNNPIDLMEALQKSLSLVQNNSNSMPSSPS